MTNKLKTWQYWRDEWVYPVAIAIIIAIFIRIFIVQPFKIPSLSMYPTLKVGDRIFVNKFLYGARVPIIKKRLPKVRDPRRGDVVVFVSVEDSVYPFPRENYIRLVGPVFFNRADKRFKWHTGPRYIVKRLVGLPGDHVEIKSGDIYIDGQLLDDPFIFKSFHYFNADDYGSEGGSITVPENSYFVLGDNSNNSHDSRFWGFVPKSHLTGKVFLIWWPGKRIQLLK